MLRAVFREGNPLSSGLNSCVAKNRLKRFSVRPRRRVDWLAVIMRVKNHRAFRFRREQLAEHHRPASADRQQMRFDSACLKHLDKVRRIPLNVGCVAGDVGNRQKLAQLSNNAVLVVHAVIPHFLRGCRCS